MINFSYIRTINKTLVTGIIAINSLGANAALTSYSSNGVDLVYSSVSDVTWTKDGNLLRTLFADQGFNKVVRAIIATSPTVLNTPHIFNSTGRYTLTPSDFGSNGITSWYGAMAYVNYLNSIKYAGSDKWTLPTVVNTTIGYNTFTNGSTRGDESVELYYQELDGNAGPAQEFGFKDPDNKFINELGIYWSGTEYELYPTNAWLFNNNFGGKDIINKRVRLNVWAVSPGLVAAVPEPQGTAMLLVGLGLIVAVVSRRRTQCP